MYWCNFSVSLTPIESWGGGKSGGDFTTPRSLGAVVDFRNPVNIYSDDGILGSGFDRRSPKGFEGIAIGATVFIEAAGMGPITGASMNPARSLGTVLVANLWQHHWLYWVAPILGAQLAVIGYRYLSSNFQDI
jgi:glycerol uptake facilitator-like aquaporin